MYTQKLEYNKINLKLRFRVKMLFRKKEKDDNIEKKKKKRVRLVK